MRKPAKAASTAHNVIKADPYDYPDGGQLDPETTALLVIDMQNDFLSPGGYLASKGYDLTPLRAILPAVNRVIEAARAAGCLIVHTRQGHRADLADMPLGEFRNRKRPRIKEPGLLVRGSAGFEIVPELKVKSSDVIIDKTANGAFTYTELEPVLRAQGITNLLFTGCTTDVCVHSTLREAVDRSFECLLIEDACASGDAEAHTAAVKMVTVEDGIFGAVASAEAVVAALRQVRTKSPIA